MSEGVTVSLLWVLVLLLVSSLVNGYLLLLLHGALVMRLDALNLQLVRWRAQFSKTFTYIEDDEDINDLWGQEEAQ